MTTYIYICDKYRTSNARKQMRQPRMGLQETAGHLSFQGFHRYFTEILMMNDTLPISARGRLICLLGFYM